MSLTSENAAAVMSRATRRFVDLTKAERAQALIDAFHGRRVRREIEQIRAEVGPVPGLYRDAVTVHSREPIAIEPCVALRVGMRVTTSIRTCSMWTPPHGSLGTIVGSQMRGPWFAWTVDVDGTPGEWSCAPGELSVAPRLAPACREIAQGRMTDTRNTRSRTEQ